MSFRLFIAISALAFSAASHACSVTIGPFDVTEKKASAAEISSITCTHAIGVVVTESTVKADGCNITVEFTPAILYTAKELDACGLRHVLEHERKHVAIYRAGIATMADDIAAGGYTYKAAMAAMAAIRAKHAELDDGEEYHHNPHICNGSIVAASR